MGHAKNKLIVVEDDRFWRTALYDALVDAGYNVRASADGMSAIDQIRDDVPDLVVMDYYLPTVDAQRLGKYIKEQAEYSHIRTVVLSAALVGGMDRKSLPHADAAIAKGPLHRTIPRLLEIIEDLLERHEKDKYRDAIVEPVPLQPRELSRKLYRLKEYVNALHVNLSDVICEIDAERRIVRVNPTGQALIGRPEHDMLGANLLQVLRQPPESPLASAIETVLQPDSGVTAGAADFTFRGRHLSASVARLYAAPDETAMIIVARDMTERLRTEAVLDETEKQLHHSMKMEAVGRLAGGVAHDFNNLLTSITGYTELLLADKEITPRMRADLDEILHSSERAADLTRQLLAFARKQIVRPRVLELNALLLETRKMLQRMIGEDIELEASLAEHLGRVYIDPGQVEQIVMNLAVNARDAMPSGGTMTLATSNLELAEPRELPSGTQPPGSYVCMTISDTGRGMDPETIEHIFEPFFTTKSAAKGSGLGLSTVYGIVKQAGGELGVESEAGKGSSLTVYLPRCDDLLSEKPRGTPDEETLRGTETVLVVEDEPQLLKLMARALETFGYRVLTAADGEQALELHGSLGVNAQLLITDIVMPKLGGRELADKLVALQPDLKLLFISGYVGDDSPPGGLDALPKPLLAKPFTPMELAARVREVLDSRAPRSE